MNGFVGIGLHRPKTPSNVGSVLRAAHCYGASFVASTERRYRGSATDTPKAYRHIPFHKGLEDLRSIIPHDCIPVAIDLLPDAIPLPEYEHPKRAFYVFGPEDGTLGKAVTDWCAHKVYVPTRDCMNLAATVNVILYDRLLKSQTESPRLFAVAGVR